MRVLAHAPERAGWDTIHAPGTSLHLQAAEAPDATWVQALLAEAPFAWRMEGTPDAIKAELRALPAALQEDMLDKVARFCALMQVPEVGVRLEGITGNACTKVHADYTDVRLIQTYAGPGTDYAPHGDADAPLERVPTGWIGLFKGRAYPRQSASGHAPCLHRSPPIEGSGARRLVLLIDTVPAK